jgi:hypothetical protein
MSDYQELEESFSVNNILEKFLFSALYPLYNQVLENFINNTSFVG